MILQFLVTGYIVYKKMPVAEHSIDFLNPSFSMTSSIFLIFSILSKAL